MSIMIHWAGYAVVTPQIVKFGMLAVRQSDTDEERTGWPYFSNAVYYGFSSCQNKLGMAEKARK